jgi:hypothetical protein
MRTSICLASLMLVVGCGSDPTENEACTKIAQDRCSQLQSCSAADLARRWTDLATCESRETLSCTEGLSAPKTGNNPSAVESCASALVAETCPAFLAGVNPPAACVTKKGPRANGMPCSFPAQCSSAFCAVASNALCGVCAAQPNPGDSCAAQTCGQDMVCVASTQLCQVPAAMGATCMQALPCGQGLACVGASMTTAGTCMPQATMIGAACDQRRMTAADCDPAAGLTCDRATNQCVMEPLVPTGGTCGNVNGVDNACSGGATCARPPASPTGTCVAPATDGGACDSASGPDCLFPARCVPTVSGGTAGTCQLPGSQSC